MREIDFLPPRYVQSQRRRRRLLVRCVAAAVSTFVSFLCVALAHAHH
jgi:hypothetical protein